MSTQKPLTIFGSFGFGNIGDEAIPYALADLLQQLKLDYELSIVSRFDSPAMDSVIGLGAVHTDTLDKLRGQPSIIAGGGIVEAKDISSILRYKHYIEKVQPSHSAIIAGSFEFGVNYGWKIKRQLRHVFSQMDAIYTRDYLSELYFKETFPEQQVSTLGDMVLGMKADAEKPADISLEKDHYIAVCLSDTWSKDPEWLPWIGDELKALSNTLNRPLLFVPMSCHSSDDDRIEHRRISEHLKANGIKHEPHTLDQQYDPRAVSAILRDAHLVIAMRLHSCVMAYAQQTPFVGISYHPKLMGFAQTVGWRPFLLPAKNAPMKQDTDKYGYAFSSLTLQQGDLVTMADKALEHGEFNLLPVLIDNLKQALQHFLNR